MGRGIGKGDLIGRGTKEGRHGEIKGGEVCGVRERGKG